MRLIQWFFNRHSDGSESGVAGVDPLPRKPKPKDWQSKLIRAMTVAPRKGQVTQWIQQRPPVEGSIEVIPMDSKPKPEHYMPTGLKPPPAFYQSSQFWWWAIIIGCLLAVSAYTYFHK